MTISFCLCEQGLLALEGELTPILVQMVKSANMNGLLDNDSDSLSSCQHRVKARLHEILQKDRDFTDEDFDRVISELHLTLWAEYMSFLWVPEEGRRIQRWETWVVCTLKTPLLFRTLAAAFRSYSTTTCILTWSTFSFLFVSCQDLYWNLQTCCLPQTKSSSSQSSSVSSSSFFVFVFFFG